MAGLGQLGQISQGFGLWLWSDLNDVVVSATGESKRLHGALGHLLAGLQQNPPPVCVHRHMVLVGAIRRLGEARSNGWRRRRSHQGIIF